MPKISMLERYTLTAMLTLAALTACEANNDGASANTEEPASDSARNFEEPVSILRPDIEQPVLPEPEPEDLQVVIGFSDGGSELDDAALLALQKVLASPQIALGGDIVLRGHSDAGGGSEVNQRASQERAEAVADWLTDKGIDEDRIEIIALGLQNPVAPNALPDGKPDEGGRALNRRVEVDVLLPRPDSGADREARNASSGNTGD